MDALVDGFHIDRYGVFRAQPHTIETDEALRQENRQRIELDCRYRAIVAAVAAEGASIGIDLPGWQDGFGLCDAEL